MFVYDAVSARFRYGRRIPVTNLNKKISNYSIERLLYFNMIIFPGVIAMVFDCKEPVDHNQFFET